MKMTLASRLP